MHRSPSRTLQMLVAAGAVVLGTAGVSQANGADAVTVHQRGVDVNPGSQNPCSGVMGTVVDLNDIHFHVTTRPDGLLEETGHNTADVSFMPDDPAYPSYHGHETYAFHETGSKDTSTTTTTFHVRMNGTDGTWLDVREVAHLTVGPDGSPVVTFDRARLGCS
jgi:hypothetical protein